MAQGAFSMIGGLCENGADRLLVVDAVVDFSKAHLVFAQGVFHDLYGQTDQVWNSFGGGGWTIADL